MGLVDGVTTNPSLIAKSGRKYKDVVVEICELVNGPISRRGARRPTYDEMMAEAREWHKVHKNIVVKLPLIPDGLKGGAHLHAGGHPHQRHALLLAQPGAARRQGGRQLHLAVHRPPRRHQRDRAWT